MKREVVSPDALSHDLIKCGTLLLLRSQLNYSPIIIAY